VSEPRTYDQARAALSRFIASLKPAKRNLMQHLLDRFEVFVPRAELVKAAYEAGGYVPSDPGNAVGAHLADLRPMIASYGFEIEGRTKRGSRLKWKAEEAADA
jgi:hypothetical protein